MELKLVLLKHLLRTMFSNTAGLKGLNTLRVLIRITDYIHGKEEQVLTFLLPRRRGQWSDRVSFRMDQAAWLSLKVVSSWKGPT